MKENTKFDADNEILEMFGLTLEQTKLMFSVQKIIAEKDWDRTPPVNKIKKERDYKREWIDDWEKSILLYLGTERKAQEDARKRENGDLHINEGNIILQNSWYEYKINESLYSNDELPYRFKEEICKSPNNKTWYYIILLECLAFTPYTPLHNCTPQNEAIEAEKRERKENEEKEKHYKKCDFSKQAANFKLQWIKDIFVKHGIVTEEKIDRMYKVLQKNIDNISGKKSKMVIQLLMITVITVATAGIAAVAAGPIAVAIFGSAYAELSGAALTSACLAMAGGGAISVGGAGIAGGVAAIAGGGAVLGMAGGSTAVGAASKLLISSPDFTLTQAAKLETILKEVILNGQKDVATAQKIIAQCKKQIDELTNKLNELELENSKNKEEIKRIKQCIAYMKNACKDMNIFTSAYETGKEAENKDGSK